MGAGSNNTWIIERELASWNESTARTEKKNKTLGTERCENIDTLCINKMCVCVYVCMYVCVSVCVYVCVCV